ncbi:MAG: MBL fold metallo-hydrolase [Xanthobacteraceae bacterium]|nr:MBL fold metallo-hydrolase [Xanthobacteraceae bacterium]
MQDATGRVPGARQGGEVAPPRRQIPGVYHRRVGDIVVTALSDGYLDAPYTVMRIAPGDAEEILAREFRPSPPRISVNCFAIYSAGRLALIETGSGSSMGPTLGWLPRSLAAAGIEAGRIETILLTHMHPDHSNGLVGDAGEVHFPVAELRVHEDEVAHWHDDGRMAQATERQRVRYFEGARRQLAPYRDRLRTFRKGEVFPGVTAVPIPGHTPGHTAFRVESGGEGLLIWGDTVHVPEIQVARPDVTMEFDSDPAAAAATRRRIFDMAVADRLLVGGMHIHFPGFARMARRGDGYVLVPDAWSFEI